MNWNISAWSIRQPVPSLVLFMVLMALGYFSFQQLPVTRFPNIDIPIVQVRVYQSGAAPSELETQVTKKIEDAIAGVNGVKHITSTVTEGSSLTIIEFRLEVNQDRALNDVKDAIARIRADLPRTIEEPIASRLEIEGLPIITYAAEAPAMTPEELSWFVDDTVVRALQGVKGVSQIQRIGGVEREIRIALDAGPAAGARHHGRRREPAGARDQRRPGRRARRDRRARAGDPHARRQATRRGSGRHHDRAAQGPQGAARSARHGRPTPSPSSAPSPRSTAGRWWRSPSPAPRAPATRSSAEDVDKTVAELRTKYPSVELTKIDNTVDYTLGVYKSTMTSMIEGAAAGDPRGARVPARLARHHHRRHRPAAVGHPGLLGHGRDGLLAEPRQPARHHHRHRHSGRRRHRRDREHRAPHAHGQVALSRRAARRPTRSASPSSPSPSRSSPCSRRSASWAASPGSISSSSAWSSRRPCSSRCWWRVSSRRCSPPISCAPSDHDEQEGWLLRTYTRLVGWSVAHRFKSVALGILIFAASIGSFYLLPSSFLPQEDTGRQLLAIELPPGSRLDDTRAVTEAVASRIRERPDVQQRVRQRRQPAGLGRRGAQGDADHQSGAEGRSASWTQAEIKEEIGRDLAGMPDMRYWFLNDDGQRQFQLVVAGRDAAAVNKVAAELTSEAKRLPHACQRGVHGRARPAGAARLSQDRNRRRPRRLDRGHLGGRAHRHHRRRGRQPRQVRRRRPPGADPRAARREGAHGPAYPGSAEGLDRRRRGRAAVGGRHVRDEPGADRHRPLRPHAPHRHRRRPRRRCAARRCREDADAGAGGQEPAGRRGAQAVRRTRRSWARCSRASPRPWSPA